MADPSTYRPAPGEIPLSPGVYRFRDEYQRVIYVGKAKNLRARLANYFQDVSSLHPRTQAMVTTAASVEWTVVGTEVEALTLEYTWIKEFDPRFNVKYRDDKSYPYLAVTMGEEYPRALVLRGAKRPGTRYFGPYGHAWAIRETLDLLLRVFPVRTCSPGVLRRAQASGRPCLLGYIDKCSAPCVGRVSESEHRALAEEFCEFMAGDTAKFVRRLHQDMATAAAAMQYERAATLRDDIAALERATEKNAIALPDGTDADVFALVGDELEAAVQVFHVRGGRIRGQRGWIVEKVEDATDADLIERLLAQIYADRESVPREVLVPVLPSDPDPVVQWLTQLRGARVQLRVPQRGDKKELAGTVRRNAEHALALHRTRRAGDLTTRSQALSEIQEVLGLESAPLRIECYDISTTQGTHQAASMVVFEDGLARKSEYRHFGVHGPHGQGAQDDTAAMYEVMTRRFTRHRAEQARFAQSGAGHDPEASSALLDPSSDLDTTTARPTRFAYPPHLVVVDGGQPQVAAAARALSDVGITDIALVGLAKRLEEVWLPDQDYPIILPRGSQGLYLLQRVRDEAHRFALSYHRTKRSRAMLASELDGIPGLGPTRIQALLTHFGSVTKLRRATSEEIAHVRGIGPQLALAIQVALAPKVPTSTDGSTAPHGADTCEATPADP